MPKELKAGSFTRADAARAGLSRWHLEGANWRRMGRTVFVWAGLPDTPELRIEAARQRLPASAVFSGLTAAWLHGLDVEGCKPIEVTIPKYVCVWKRTGIAVRRAALTPGDTVKRRGQRATSVLRTLSDLSIRLTVTEAVVVADMALHAGLATIADLDGVASLRRVASFAEPATESPMESRLRMLLVLGGLPRPQAQMSLYDSRDRFVGRPDLYYSDQRLGIEYDGVVHRTTLAADNRRQNRLLAAEFRLLRFTADDVRENPESVTAQVRAMLG